MYGQKYMDSVCRNLEFVLGFTRGVWRRRPVFSSVVFIEGCTTTRRRLLSYCRKCRIRGPVFRVSTYEFYAARASANVYSTQIIIKRINAIITTRCVHEHMHAGLGTMRSRCPAIFEITLTIMPIKSINNINNNNTPHVEFKPTELCHTKKNSLLSAHKTNI
jgi:hypothetical protein